MRMIVARESVIKLYWNVFWSAGRICRLHQARIPAKKQIFFIHYIIMHRDIGEFFISIPEFGFKSVDYGGV